MCFKAIKMFEIQPGKERCAGAVQNQARRLHRWKDPLVALGAPPPDRAAMVSSPRWAMLYSEPTRDPRVATLEPASVDEFLDDQVADGLFSLAHKTDIMAHLCVRLRDRAPGAVARSETVEIRTIRHTMPQCLNDSSAIRCQGLRMNNDAEKHNDHHE
ncbi:hypothetical protein GFL78_11670 [Rhizobium leguminosarum bv. viciae]|nr:hypothetical protein [Rhizobium leguminosarum bv. viciae]NKQ86820.1 hypothetical protein [Rhizobium ruizarguesonis]NKL30756.1 hypothetical protein [Rhizobium leguminosarum bv. viciae]NKL41848.1 hypothetical protein [Rhizobium leguminosarum bv. viciae]TBD11500.1 hypothetical protein ELH20_35195 [Rhizobium ruizarguesonis]